MSCTPGALSPSGCTWKPADSHQSHRSPFCHEVAAATAAETPPLYRQRVQQTHLHLDSFDSNSSAVLSVYATHTIQKCVILNTPLSKMSSLCWVFLHHPPGEKLGMMEATHTYEKVQSRNISHPVFFCLFTCECKQACISCVSAGGAAVITELSLSSGVQRQKPQSSTGILNRHRWLVGHYHLGIICAVNNAFTLFPPSLWWKVGIFKKKSTQTDLCAADILFSLCQLKPEHPFFFFFFF